MKNDLQKPRAAWSNGKPTNQAEFDAKYKGKTGALDLANAMNDWADMKAQSENPPPKIMLWYARNGIWTFPLTVIAFVLIVLPLLDSWF